MTKTRIFMTSDVHGSDKTFRKFVSAGPFYKADVVIVGGDLTGKRIIPIVNQKDGSYKANFYDKVVTMRSEKEIADLEQQIKDAGFYYTRLDNEQVAKLSDEEEVEKLFSELMIERIREWINLLDKHMEGKKIRCYVQPGNDDRFVIDPMLDEAKNIINPEGNVIKIDESHEMISTGFSNITPWKCPRDIPEEDLEKKIEAMTSKVENMENCIFNFHVPPYDTSIDYAPRLTEDLKVVTEGGAPSMIPVGSKAVRKSIDTHQPLLGLHGHIHESRGIHRLGRTLCVNPGSEYSEGILRGVIVNLSDGKIKDYTFTSG